MKAIDTKSWAEFKVGDLFTQLRGKESAPNRVPDGDYNMINETSVNNGISKKAHSEYIFEAPAITVSVNYAQTVFLQQEPFCASVNILILKADFLEKYPNAGLYIVTLLRKANEKYNYGSKISKIKLNETIIPIPVQQTLDPDKTYHPEGYIPDWNYMEAFMEQINQQTQARLDEYKDGKVEYTPVDTESWQEFKIGELFETNNEKAYTGASVKRENLIPGETPRVTVSNINNGITGYYEDIEDTNYRVYNNFISVSFLGTVFYHPYSASVDMKVHVLPKLTNGRDLTTGIGLFLVSAIKASIKRYTYANQISSKVIYDTYIQLPVDQTGQPDWNYMESFMKQINQQAQAKLQQLEKGKA